MYTYYIYRPADITEHGFARIRRTGTCPDAALSLQAQDGEAVGTGEVDPLCDCVVLDPETGHPTIAPKPDPLEAPMRRAKSESPARAITRLRTAYDAHPTAVTQTHLDALREAIARRIPQRRYEVETGGITFAGHTIPTDRQSQSLISDAHRRATMDPQFQVRWKCSPGVWIDVDAPAMVALGDALFVHVEGCFALEEQLDSDLTAATDYTGLCALADAVEGFHLT